MIDQNVMEIAKSLLDLRERKREALDRREAQEKYLQKLSDHEYKYNKEQWESLQNCIKHQQKKDSPSLVTYSLSKKCSKVSKNFRKKNPMTGTLEVNKTTRYDIIKKWANKSHIQKDARVDVLLDEILKSDLAYDIIEEKKIEAVVIAEMILRSHYS